MEMVGGLRQWKHAPPRIGSLRPSLAKAWLELSLVGEAMGVVVGVMGCAGEHAGSTMVRACCKVRASMLWEVRARIY